MKNNLFQTTNKGQIGHRTLLSGKKQCLEFAIMTRLFMKIVHTDSSSIVEEYQRVFTLLAIKMRSIIFRNVFASETALGSFFVKDASNKANGIFKS